MVVINRRGCAGSLRDLHNDVGNEEDFRKMSLVDRIESELHWDFEWHSSHQNEESGLIGWTHSLRCHSWFWGWWSHSEGKDKENCSDPRCPSLWVQSAPIQHPPCSCALLKSVCSIWFSCVIGNWGKVSCRHSSHPHGVSFHVQYPCHSEVDTKAMISWPPPHLPWKIKKY